jgi:hypothetical protein
MSELPNNQHDANVWLTERINGPSPLGPVDYSEIENCVRALDWIAEKYKLGWELGYDHAGQWSGYTVRIGPEIDEGKGVWRESNLTWAICKVLMQVLSDPRLLP